MHVTVKGFRSQRRNWLKDERVFCFCLRAFARLNLSGSGTQVTLTTVPVGRAGTIIIASAVIVGSRDVPFPPSIDSTTQVVKWAPLDFLADSYCRV